MWPHVIEVYNIMKRLGITFVFLLSIQKKALVNSVDPDHAASKEAVLSQRA